jgi:hypothetical protein
MMRLFSPGQQGPITNPITRFLYCTPMTPSGSITVLHAFNGDGAILNGAEGPVLKLR